MAEKCLLCEDYVVTDKCGVGEKGIDGLIKASIARKDGKHELFRGQKKIVLHASKKKYTRPQSITRDLKIAVLDEQPLTSSSTPVCVHPNLNLILKQLEGYFGTDLVIFNLGQITRKTPQLAPPSPNFLTTPVGGRLACDLTCNKFNTRQIFNGIEFRAWNPAAQGREFTTRPPRPDLMPGNHSKFRCSIRIFDNGSDGQPLFPELVDVICGWIADRKAKSLVCRMTA
ncbi:hypothetical protein AVEN_9630-1 [Araneus ventricosus]|uniref:Uncharacterized protein n=1 Tax=Araneus ventricosus TaxID=182803 RepID=A0A4Y2EYI6_ARAVE|nr:hypothetical protein AVEN_9630-1 [Araneus ventricosus]